MFDDLVATCCLSYPGQVCLNTEMGGPFNFFLLKSHKHKSIGRNVKLQISSQKLSGQSKDLKPTKKLLSIISLYGLVPLFVTYESENVEYDLNMVVPPYTFSFIKYDSYILNDLVATCCPSDRGQVRLNTEMVGLFKYFFLLKSYKHNSLERNFKLQISSQKLSGQSKDLKLTKKFLNNISLEFSCSNNIYFFHFD